jgi:hypothetical protein
MIATTKLSSSNLGTQAPASVLGVARLVYQTPLFSATTLALLDFQSTTIFQMVATSCDGVDTLGMVVTPIKDSHEVLFNQPPVG